jgi:N-acetyl-gamma-glutamyl-phosphate reductase
MSTGVRVAVIGASGYTGGELLRLLEGHPAARTMLVGASRSAGSTVAEQQPHLAAAASGGLVLREAGPDEVADAADLAFLALPHGRSAALAPPLVERGVRVIDLGGDFRLPAEAYPEWYGFEHPAPEWLDKAVYGIPELFAAQIAGAAFVANPGCYPTAAILSVAPPIGAGLLEDGPILIDGKTGLSGAGRSASEATSFASVEESIRPYRFPRHQHTPEIERGIELATGITVSVSFVPHLVPAVRGVVTTSYAAAGAGTTTETLTECLEAAYEGRPFVRVLPPGSMADSKRVRGTNVIELQAAVDHRTGTAVVVAAVDNLVKGAAGQAIQNMNVALGLDEAAGLPILGVYP